MIQKALLVYSSMLRKAQYKTLRDLATVHHGALDIVLVEQAMREGVSKRLALAQAFVDFADGLLTASQVSDIAARNAVSRAYYATHHAMRALLLFEERGDVDGHREAIEAVHSLLKRNSAARSKLGGAEEFRDSVLDLLDKRHLADYYPYGTNSPNEQETDFPSAAVAALDFARRIVDKIGEYITQKEAKKI